VQARDCHNHPGLFLLFELWSKPWCVHAELWSKPWSS